MKNELLIFILLLIGWYYSFYQLFLIKDFEIGSSPQLRNRLGTILWHSSDKNGKTDGAIFDPNYVAHTYCYYPKGSTIYSNKAGEYIIKREDSGDCAGWLGKVIFHESFWVSEKEKIWWSKKQKIEEELAFKLFTS